MEKEMRSLVFWEALRSMSMHRREWFCCWSYCMYWGGCECVDVYVRVWCVLCMQVRERLWCMREYLLEFILRLCFFFSVFFFFCFLFLSLFLLFPVFCSCFSFFFDFLFFVFVHAFTPHLYFLLSLIHISLLVFLFPSIISLFLPLFFSFSLGFISILPSFPPFCFSSSSSYSSTSFSHVSCVFLLLFNWFTFEAISILLYL